MKGWKRDKVKEAYGEMERKLTPLGGWKSLRQVKEESILKVLAHSR